MIWTQHVAINHKRYLIQNRNFYPNGINVCVMVRIEIIKLIQTQKLSASLSATKIAKCDRQCCLENAKRGFSRFSCSSTPSYAPYVERIHAISIRRGSMEHINKKSFPACTRVTAHATSLQPLQPIFLALTSREAGQNGGYTRPSVREGWRRGVDENEHERVLRRERDRCERKGERERKRRARGMEIILREYLAGGGKPTANERNISLKKRPLPLFIFYPPCTIGLVGSRTSTSRIDSLAILPRTARMCSFFPRETRNSSSRR